MARITCVCLTTALTLASCGSAEKPERSFSQYAKEMEAYLDTFEKRKQQIEATKKLTLEATNRWKELRNNSAKHIGEPVHWDDIQIYSVSSANDVLAYILGDTDLPVVLRALGGTAFTDNAELPRIYERDHISVQARFAGLTQRGFPIFEVSSAINDGVK